MATKSKKTAEQEAVQDVETFVDERPLQIIAKDVSLAAEQSRPMVQGWMVDFIFFMSILMCFFALVILSVTVISSLAKEEVWAVAEGTDVYQLKILKNWIGQ